MIRTLLLGDWATKGVAMGTGTLEDPKALVTFGVWKGPDEIIYSRELY